jgi:hypothetical protein
MATEPSGPQNDRRLSVIIVNSEPVGPGGADNAVIGMKFDCTAQTSSTLTGVAYLGKKELVREDDASDPIHPSPGSPNALEYAYACDGKMPNGPAVWVDGVDAARDYAFAKIREG